MKIPYTTFTDDNGAQFNLTPGVSVYGNGRLAVELWTGEGLFTGLTVNMPNEPLEPGEVHAKNWSENTLVYHHLINVGWIFPTTKSVPSGFVHVPVVRLAGDLKTYAEAQAKSLNLKEF